MGTGGVSVKAAVSHQTGRKVFQLRIDIGFHTQQRSAILAVEV